MDKFGNEITFVKPIFKDDTDLAKYHVWEELCRNAESAYMELLSRGSKPEEARSVLPLSIKTETVMTANLREWRHFFKLRTSPFAHPEMRRITIPLLEEVKLKIPVVFDAILGVE